MHSRDVQQTRGAGFHRRFVAGRAREEEATAAAAAGSNMNRRRDFYGGGGDREKTKSSVSEQRWDCMRSLIVTVGDEVALIPQQIQRLAREGENAVLRWREEEQQQQQHALSQGTPQQQHPLSQSSHEQQQQQQQADAAGGDESSAAGLDEARVNGHAAVSAAAEATAGSGEGGESIRRVQLLSRVKQEPREEDDEEQQQHLRRRGRGDRDNDATAAERSVVKVENAACVGPGGAAVLSAYERRLAELLVACASQLPLKIGIYASLLGLWYKKSRLRPLCFQVVEGSVLLLEDSLKKGDFSKVTLLLRFFIALAGSSVLQVESVFELLKKLLSFASAVPAGATTEHLLLSTLSSLPWISVRLYEQQRNTMDGVVALAHEAAAAAGSSPEQLLLQQATLPIRVPAAAVASQNEAAANMASLGLHQTRLDSLLDALASMVEGGWRSRATLRFYQSAELELLLLRSSAAAAACTLPSLSLEAADLRDLHVLPLQRVLRLPVSIEKIDVPLASHDRWILEDYILTIFHNFRKNVALCAEQLLRIPVEHDQFEYVLVECLLSALFHLPHAPLIVDVEDAEFLVARVLHRASQLQNSLIAVVEAAMTSLVRHAAHFDYNTTRVLANFFAYWLNAWGAPSRLLEEWVGLSIPPACVKIFVKLALEKAFRLRYREELISLLPACVEPYWPANPLPQCPYTADDFPHHGRGGAAAAAGVCTPGVHEFRFLLDLLLFSFDNIFISPQCMQIRRGKKTLLRQQQQQQNACTGAAAVVVGRDMESSNPLSQQHDSTENETAAAEAAAAGTAEGARQEAAAGEGDAAATATAAAATAAAAATPGAAAEAGTAEAEAGTAEAEASVDMSDSREEGQGKSEEEASSRGEEASSVFVAETEETAAAAAADGATAAVGQDALLTEEEEMDEEAAAQCAARFHYREIAAFLQERLGRPPWKRRGVSCMDAAATPLEEYDAAAAAVPVSAQQNAEEKEEAAMDDEAAATAGREKAENATETTAAARQTAEETSSSKTTTTTQQLVWSACSLAEVFVYALLSKGMKTLTHTDRLLQNYTPILRFLVEGASDEALSTLLQAPEQMHAAAERKQTAAAAAVEEEKETAANAAAEETAANATAEETAANAEEEESNSPQQQQQQNAVKNTSPDTAAAAAQVENAILQTIFHYWKFCSQKTVLTVQQFEQRGVIGKESIIRFLFEELSAEEKDESRVMEIVEMVLQHAINESLLKRKEESLLSAATAATAAATAAATQEQQQLSLRQQQAAAAAATAAATAAAEKLVHRVLIYMMRELLREEAAVRRGTLQARLLYISRDYASYINVSTLHEELTDIVCPELTQFLAVTYQVQQHYHFLHSDRVEPQAATTAAAALEEDGQTTVLQQQQQETAAPAAGATQSAAANRLMQQQQQPQTLLSAAPLLAS